MNFNTLNTHGLLGNTGFDPWRFLAGLTVTTPADASTAQPNTTVQPAAADTNGAPIPATTAPAATGTDTSGVTGGTATPASDTAAPTPADGTNAQPPAAATPTDQQLGYSDWQQSRRLEMTVHTREGDTVTLYIERDRSVSDALYVQNGADQQTLGLSHSAQSSLDIGYTVNGSLSQDELNAIGRLAKQVGRLADKYFSGNVPATVNKIQALGFDSRTLTDFALNLSVSETRTTVQAYTGTTGPSGADTAAATPAADVTSLADFTQGLKQLLSDKPLNKTFDTGGIVRDVFQRVGEHHGRSHHHGHHHHHHHHRHDFMNALNAIMNQLTQSAQNDAGGGDATTTAAGGNPVPPEQPAPPASAPAA